MTTDVELPEIDLKALEARMAAKQRELLKLAMHKPSGRQRPDGAAAAKLLLYFSREMIVDRDVQEAIMDGAREVAAYVANETLLQQDGQPVIVRPLMYFHGVDFDYTETKKNKKDQRVALAVAFNDPHLTRAGKSGTPPLMTPEEAQYALTTKWTQKDAKDQKFGKPKYRDDWPRRDRKEWPRTVRAVEQVLMKYAAARHGLTSTKACQSYVHASFPENAWVDDADKQAVYPAEWE